jgi:rubrerythrin
MLRSVVLDMLSEFLMVEQGGFQLYRTALARCSTPELKARYTEFLEETARHRELLMGVIRQLGGDPSYVSPTARLAQFKTSKLLEAALVVDGLSQAEVELSDLENVLLAETKDHADWSLLQRLLEQTGQSGADRADQVDPDTLQAALRPAVAEVEPEEDQHLEWARDMQAQLALRLATLGPAPSPERWQSRISTPDVPIESVNPRPIRQGLLEHAGDPQWQPSEIVRATAAPTPP